MNIKYVILGICDIINSSSFNILFTVSHVVSCIFTLEEKIQTYQHSTTKPHYLRSELASDTVDLLLSWWNQEPYTPFKLMQIFLLPNWFYSGITDFYIETLLVLD